MGNMCKAMSMRSLVLSERVEKMTNEEARIELENIRKRIKVRIESNIDIEDSFISNNIDETLESLLHSKINQSTKTNLIGKQIEIDGYKVKVIGCREYNIVKGNLVDVVVNSFSCKGKGARKFIDDIDNIYNLLGTKNGRKLLGIK